MTLENVRVIAVRTYHPGNIGAIARAMKNMGLQDLVLVNPKSFPDDEALSRAAGATNIIEKAKVVSSLEEAVADCEHVYATSARRRGFEWPMESSRKAMDSASNYLESGDKVAIVFGPERSGLESHELRLANNHVYIPANPEYDVLNVSAAAQLLFYDLWMCQLDKENTQNTHYDFNNSSKELQYPTHQEMNYFYEHLEKTFIETGFIRANHPGNTMIKLKRLFNRVRPEKNELSILRGMLNSVDQKVRQNEQS